MSLVSALFLNKILLCLIALAKAQVMLPILSMHNPYIIIVILLLSCIINTNIGHKLALIYKIMHKHLFVGGALPVQAAVALVVQLETPV